MSKKGEVKYTQYVVEKDKYYYPSSDIQLAKSLPAGYYELKYSNQTGIYVMRRDIITDELLNLPLKVFNNVLNDINTFWSKESKFDEYGFVFKRGILLHGAPGGGKTSLIKLLADNLIKNYNGIVIRIFDSRDLNLYGDFMEEIFRVIEPDRPIITVIEDVDGLCRQEGAETSLINILDGITQSRKVVYVATTNYVEKLKARITNRPSRFDRIYHIGLPDEKVRRFYLENVIKPEDMSKVDIDLWIKETDRFTYAHLRDLIASVLILGNSFEEAIAHLKKMNTNKPKDSNIRKVGIDEDPEDEDDFAEYDEDEEDYEDDNGDDYEDDPEDDSEEDDYDSDSPGGWDKKGD